MNSIKMYDPAMCCSTGVCGPSIDPELLRVSFVFNNLTKRSYSIERFNLSNDPTAFIDNILVNTLLNEKGVDSLPIILLNEEVVISGRYPTSEEFEKWTEISAEELIQKPRIRLSMKGVKL